MNSSSAVDSDEIPLKIEVRSAGKKGRRSL